MSAADCQGVAVLVVVLALTVSGRVQATPATSTQAAAPTAPSAGASGSPANPPATAVEAASPQGFTYNPEGRRDPFVSLQGRGADPARGPNASRPPGLAGLAVSEVTLRGTIRRGQGLLAILHGADARNYVVRPGERLADGVVRAITADAIVFLQEVSDPPSREKYREIRMGLRQTEEAK